MSFCQKVVETAQAQGERIATTLLAPQGAENLSFGEMLRHIRSLAFRLGQEGIAPGDRVALIGENHPHWGLAYLGTLYHGAVIVPLDPSAPVETLAAFIEDAGAKLAFIAESAREKLDAVCERLGRPIPRVMLQRQGDAPCFEDWAATPFTPEFEATPPTPQGDDLALLMYTSGTTGKPKAVPLTHGNIHAESKGVQEVMRLSHEEVILSVLPLYHAYSQIVNLWIATTIGCKIVYLNELNPQEIARGLKEGGITTLTGVPRLWYLFHKKIFDAAREQPKPLRVLFAGMLKLNGGLRDVLGVNLGRAMFGRVHQGMGGKLRLAISAGSSFDAGVARDFHALGFTILQGYGLTETSGAATVTRFEDNKVGSVGTPLNGVEVKIDAPNAEGIGEVLIRGPIVMPGYYRNPEANAEAFTADKWFRSGDLGRFDKDGHLYIVGRKKDVIVLPSGKNIYPEDVEAHYAHSPLVEELCVLGVRDEAAGFAGAEKLCAVVVPDFAYLKKNRIANAYEAIRFDLDGLGREIPEAQRVRDYVMRAEPLPRTSIRKVKRFELKKQIEAAGAVSRQARAPESWVFSEDDNRLMQTPAAQALAAAVRLHAPDAEVIHPAMNLEIDLGLDSLARAECVAKLEQILNVNFAPEDVTAAHTFGELAQLAEQPAAGSRQPAVSGKENNTPPALIPHPSSLIPSMDWQEILANAPPDTPEVQPILRPRPLAAFVSFVILRLIYLCARVFLRMEVTGLENVQKLRQPFLVSPNHQSYLDAVLVCSAYPRHLLQDVFHVGASEYFNNTVTRQLARLLNIVPVDPDANLLKAMRAGAVGLRVGKILNIYPEGERSFDGALHPFKKGAAILASELDLPVVPVALDGVYKVWPRGSNRIRPAKVKIHFGEPMNLREIAAQTADKEAGYEKATAALKQRIAAMLEQLR
jgi:long-chain acyl-CoA synthetase